MKAWVRRFLSDFLIASAMEIIGWLDFLFSGVVSVFKNSLRNYSLIGGWVTFIYGIST